MARKRRPLSATMDSVPELLVARQAAQTMMGMIYNSSLPVTTRQSLARAMGYEFQGERDIYTALGYKKDLGFNDFEVRFLRQDIGKTIVQAPCDESWKDDPMVIEKGTEEEETEFEGRWKELASDKELGLFHHLYRLDVLSGIGRYGVLFIGFDDVKKVEDHSKPAKSSEMIFLTPLSEVNAQISTYDRNPNSKRNGQPETYKLQVGESSDTQSAITAHHSRVVHVAEGALENGIFGRPRLQAVYNRLMDLERVVGAAGEGFWQMGFPGMHFDIRDDFQPDPDDLDTVKGQIEDYIHRFTRVLRTQGIDVKTLQSQMADPQKIQTAIIDLIAGATGIPKRILIGSERGDLASTQDEVAWAKRIDVRRKRHLNPHILDGLILRCINAGVLPKSENGWEYQWADLLSPSALDRATINKTNTEAFTKFADSLNSQELIPPDIYLKHFLGFSEEEVQKIKNAQEEIIAEIKKQKDEEASAIDGERQAQIELDDRRRGEDFDFERERRAGNE